MEWTEASCATGGAYLLHLFFSEEPAEIAEAKAICRGCPIRIPCLESASARREPWGVWGGELFDRGVAVEFKRPRGRPRKRPIQEPELEPVASASGEAEVA
ncbi:MAG: WhiB family transcriptional regulator [Acidobacteria bacterium]|nr:WhiB family transcriptional regulator [Acidobacteriota bacterium]